MHFWGRPLKGLGDGDGELEESSPPGGTHIITFLGGRGGECFPPGIQGNFIGWQESKGGEKRKKKSKSNYISYPLRSTVQTDKQSSWPIRHDSDDSAEWFELGRGNATLLY